MANKIVKNKKQYMLGGQGALNSRARDETALEALYTSTNGASWTNNTGWASSGMSLDGNIHGITTATIDGELRVTKIDLRSNNLTGSIDIPELGNLKQMTLFNVAHNFLDTSYPNSIHNATALEYLYLNYSDHSLESDSYPEMQPHEYVANESPGHLDPGKDSGTGNTIIRGSVGSSIDQLANLKYFTLSFTDDFGESSRTPNTINGIESIHPNIWNISTLEVIQIYDNWNIAGSGNTFSFPSTISHISNLEQVFLGGGNGTTWDHDEQGFMTGEYPSDIDQLTDVTTLWTERNPALTGFPDLANSTEFISLVISFTNMTGNLPSWLAEGTHNELDSFSIGHPVGEGMTGEIIGISPEMTRIDNVDVVGHSFEGAIPTGVWDLDPNKINFGSNNFTSIGRTDLTGLRSMSTMRFYRNEIEGEQWPKLDWDGAKGSDMTRWNRIRFEKNRYVFQDMLYVPSNAPNGETTLELYLQLEIDASMARLTYENQKPAGTTNTYNSTDGNGDIVIDDFDSTYGHTDNSYQWQKSTDGGSLWSDISGATSKTYTITGATSSDNGLYRVRVTNSTEATLASNYGKTAQTLTSKEITVSL